MKSISGFFQIDQIDQSRDFLQLDSFCAIVTFNVLKCIGGSIGHFQDTIDVVMSFLEGLEGCDVMKLVELSIGEISESSNFFPILPQLFLIFLIDILHTSAQSMALFLVSHVWISHWIDTENPKFFNSHVARSDLGYGIAPSKICGKDAAWPRVNRDAKNGPSWVCSLFFFNRCRILQNSQCWRPESTISPDEDLHVILVVFGNCSGRKSSNDNVIYLYLLVFYCW